MLAVVFEFLFEMPFAQGIFEAGHDGALAEGLVKIIVRAGAHGFDAYVHVVHTGGDKKRHVRMLVANLGEQFHTAETWHLKVGNDRVETLPLQSHEGFFRGAGGCTAKSWSCQDEGKKFDCGGLVIYGQDADCRGTVRGSVRRMACLFRRLILCVFLRGNVHKSHYCSTQGPVFSDRKSVV